MSHTPTPWHASGPMVCSGGLKFEDGKEPIHIESGWVDGAWADDPDAHANAAFIAQACNAYERLCAVNAELLAACAAVVNAANRYVEPIHYKVREAIDNCRTAAAHAKEKP